MKIREVLVGVWELLSYQIRNSDGTVELPFGAARGLLIYTADGFMSGQVMREERASPMDGYIAYCGRWRVDETTEEVIHTVTASLYPKWVGSEQRRGVRMEGEDSLTLAAPFMKDGAARVGILRWRRVSNR
jgi:hypothetical protein